MPEITYPIDIDAAKAVVEKHRVAWEKAREQMDSMVSNAVLTKSHLPDNYWLHEHRAHGLYQSAKMLVEVLSEVQHQPA